MGHGHTKTSICYAYERWTAGNGESTRKKDRTSWSREAVVVADSLHVELGCWRAVVEPFSKLAIEEGWRMALTQRGTQAVKRSQRAHEDDHLNSDGLDSDGASCDDETSESSCEDHDEEDGDKETGGADAGHQRNDSPVHAVRGSALSEEPSMLGLLASVRQDIRASEQKQSQSTTPSSEDEVVGTNARGTKRPKLDKLPLQVCGGQDGEVGEAAL